jgi:CheY-like chemotaxis protein
MRVLVIDDEFDYLELIGIMLRRGKHEAVLKSSAVEALLELAADSEFDAVLTDMLMPEKSGLEVIAEVRRRRPDLRIVAMSGGGRALPAERALNLSGGDGANRVLLKPLSAQELLEALEPTAEPK